MAQVAPSTARFHHRLLEVLVAIQYRRLDPLVVAQFHGRTRILAVSQSRVKVTTDRVVNLRQVYPQAVAPVFDRSRPLAVITRKRLNRRRKCKDSP